MNYENNIVSETTLRNLINEEILKKQNIQNILMLQIARNNGLNQNIENIRIQLRNIENSKSWQLTAFLRKFSLRLRGYVKKISSFPSRSRRKNKFAIKIEQEIKLIRTNFS